MRQCNARKNEGKKAKAASEEEEKEKSAPKVTLFPFSPLSPFSFHGCTMATNLTTHLSYYQTIERSREGTILQKYYCVQTLSINYQLYLPLVNLQWALGKLNISILCTRPISWNQDMHPSYQYPFRSIVIKLMKRHCMYSWHYIIHSLYYCSNDTICLIWIVFLLTTRAVVLGVI